MPLNMNTVGTGNGIGGGSSGSTYGGQSDFTYQMFPSTSGINISSVSGFGDTCGIIDEDNMYPPMFKLNNVWYFWNWYRGNPEYSPDVYKVVYNYDPSKSQYDQFTETVTGISLSGQYDYTGERIHVYNGYAWFVTYGANSNSVQIYRTNITSKTSTLVYTSPYMNRRIDKVEWFPMNSDGSRVFIRTKYNPYSSSDYTYYEPVFLIINISPTGTITTEKLIRYNNSYRADQISDTDPISYMTYGDLYFNNDTCIMTYGVSIVRKYKLTYKKKEGSEYTLTVTLANKYTITSNLRTDGETKFHNSYPSAPFYTNTIVTVQNGTKIHSIYQMVMSGDSDITFKQIFAAPSSGIENNPLYTASTDKTYIVVITDYNPPIIYCYGNKGRNYASPVLCEKTYSGTGYARYIGYCVAGDTICTDTGIMKVVDPNNTSKSYGTSTKQLKVTVTGKWTIDVYSPDSTSKPPCVIVDQNGCMFNTYLIIGEDNTASACLLKGTMVNNTYKAVSGVNDLSTYYQKNKRISLKK